MPNYLTKKNNLLEYKTVSLVKIISASPTLTWQACYTHSLIKLTWI